MTYARELLRRKQVRMLQKSSIQRACAHSNINMVLTDHMG